MKGRSTLLICIFLLAAACSPQNRSGARDLPAHGKRTATGDMQNRVASSIERDLREAVAGTGAASLKRENGLLIVIVDSDAGFAHDAAEIRQEIHPELDRIAQVLGRHSETMVRVEGHTDNVGTDAYNMDISYRRALAVANALVVRDIDPGRIQVLGIGRAQPVAANDTETGRQMNRRVEIKVELLQD
jgi:outer membrane protein OmpA-like peptidoglycan-associated protein